MNREKKVSNMNSVSSNATVYGEIDSLDFAIYLNKKAKEANKHINVTKLQKWLYICYGLYLALYDTQLLKERPKAWEYGPAFPRVHTAQKKNKGSLDSLVFRQTRDELGKYDDIIDAALRVFGDWTASELVEWTHNDGMAWKRTIGLEGQKAYAPMDNLDIKRDFEKLMANG